MVLLSVIFLLWSASSPCVQAIVWDIRHCRFRLQLLGHKGQVFAADLSNDASTACTASGDKVGVVGNRKWWVRAGSGGCE